MADRPLVFVQNADKQALRNAVAKAVADLDLIIAGIDTATVAQVRAAIKTLARQQRAIIRRLVQIKHG